MAKKALGRGLSALIPDIKSRGASLMKGKEDAHRSDILEIEVKKIVRNPLQPRTQFDEKEIDEMCASIKEKGIIQPILVRPKKTGYEIIAGERRFLSAKKLRLEKVPVIVKDINDEESLELAIIENIQRSDLNAIEEARAYEMLMSKYSLTQDAVGKKVGKSRESVANSLRLLKLPDDVQSFVLRGKISMGHARALLSLTSFDQQREMARRIIAQRLSVRDIEKLVAIKLSGKQGVNKMKKIREGGSLSPYVQSMAEKIQEKMGTKVIIKEKAKKGRGKIEIEYYSHDDLDRIFHLLG